MLNSPAGALLAAPPVTTGNDGISATNPEAAGGSVPATGSEAGDGGGLPFQQALVRSRALLISAAPVPSPTTAVEGGQDPSQDGKNLPLQVQATGSLLADDLLQDAGTAVASLPAAGGDGPRLPTPDETDEPGPDTMAGEVPLPVALPQIAVVKAAMTADAGSGDSQPGHARLGVTVGADIQPVSVTMPDPRKGGAGSGHSELLQRLFAPDNGQGGIQLAQLQPGSEPFVQGHQASPQSGLLQMPPAQGSGSERPAAVLNFSAPLQQQAQWGEEMGQQVKWLLSHHMHSAELKLNPPHMGAIEVRLSIQQDQVNLHFSTPHALVRDTLEDSMPRLREILQASGLDLVNVDVSQQDSSHAGGRREALFAQARDGHGPGTQASQEEQEEGERIASSIASLGRGVVDLYA